MSFLNYTTHDKTFLQHSSPYFSWMNPQNWKHTSMKLQRNLHKSNLRVALQWVQPWPYESCSQSVRPSRSSQIAVTSCHDYALTSSAPNGGFRYVHIDPPKSEQTMIQNLHPEFVPHFQKQWEDSVMMPDSTQETSYSQPVNSILVQAATSLWGWALSDLSFSL
jgi:hypothetical protein